MNNLFFVPRFLHKFKKIHPLLIEGACESNKVHLKIIDRNSPLNGVNVIAVFEMRHKRNFMIENKDYYKKYETIKYPFKMSLKIFHDKDVVKNLQSKKSITVDDFPVVPNLTLVDKVYLYFFIKYFYRQSKKTYIDWIENSFN
jgi:hypothetical protein